MCAAEPVTREPLARRVSLAHTPTPLQPMHRLARALGLPEGTLWVKRDDCTGLADGGNKVRKLEFLCADALEAGCDVLVTGGGPQSNHVRTTAAAAAKLGLDCVAVLGGDRPEWPTGNLVLDHLFGAAMVWAGPLGYYELEGAIQTEVARLTSAGRRPYLIPVGGASVRGTLGYVRAAQELVEQDGAVALVVTADGSGGTHAGLAAGLGDFGRVLGVDVGTRPDLDERVRELAARVATEAGLPPVRGACRVDHAHVGAGYGAPTIECREALDLAARTEGLVLDPVYSGKAMAALITEARAGRLATTGRIVFFHTGGTPALFTLPYAEWITRSG